MVTKAQCVEVRMLAQWCRRHGGETIFTPGFDGVISENVYQWIKNNPRGFRELVRSTPCYPSVSQETILGA